MTQNQKELSIHSSDRIRGSREGEMVLIEYADFECPHCATAAEVLERVVRKFPKQLCFVFRYFPMTEAHPYAELAAHAAEAAGRQGRFWEMHNALFSTDEDFGPALFEQFADEIGLNLEKFEKDFESDEVARRVQADVESGEALGIHETPTLFIDGEIYLGPMEEGALLTAIHERRMRSAGPKRAA